MKHRCLNTLLVSTLFGLPVFADTSFIIPEQMKSYNAQMRTSFIRNLPTWSTLNSDVCVRFFLTKKGLVRDATISKSSGSNLEDLACLDAVYSASPLSPPPTYRSVLPPPPASFMIPPDYYGEGVYLFTFNHSKGSDPTGTVPEIFRYQVIPDEVRYRYPGLFTNEELKNFDNQINIKDPPPSKIENSRFQWTKFYMEHSTATKIQIIEWAKKIRDYYF